MSKTNPERQAHHAQAGDGMKKKVPEILNRKMGALEREILCEVKE